MDRRHRRLAEMDREIEAKNRKESANVKLSDDSAEGVRQRIENLAAKDVPERAEKLARTEGIEYGAAVRQIIAEDEAFHHLPGGGSASGNDGGLAQIVAERMATDPEGYAND